jgi:hypothetical protein
MIVLLCRNRVADFSQWKGVFDSHAPAHREEGLHLRSLWRGVEERNNVFFWFEVIDPQKARAFISNPAAAEAAKTSGVLDGEYHFLESCTGFNYPS